MSDTPLDQSTDVLATSPFDGIEELADGSAMIEDASPEEAVSSFGENLVETLDKVLLNTVASELMDLIERDKKAREERDKQQEEGIRRTGLGNDTPGGASFAGANKVVHPVLAEGCIDFSARAIKELFPANGCVKTKVYGKTDDAKLEKARKKRDFLNWYVTKKMPEYRSEKEILLTQLPLGGSQYEKYWFDGDRIRMEFVPIDKCLLPFSANSFGTTSRMTHEREITENEVRDSVDSGFYVDVFGMADSQLDTTASQVASHKIEGKEDSGYNEDGLRLIYEVTCDWKLEGNKAAPYVIHLDEPSGKIAAIFRNWKEDDEKKTRLDWWVEDKFIPWRGAYGIGLHHLIGGMAVSLTGALRALLDSAHINNAAAALKLKGGRASGENINIDITSVTEIEAPAGIDDIRKLMMPLPFNPPSPVLFQLLDWLTQQAKGVVATAEERIADAGNNMPVGTTLALIEQGSITFSSIHSRLHASQGKALEIICRLIRDYPEHAEADLQRFELTSEDFAENDDVEPISDPNIFSEAQRYAQLQEALKVMAIFPDLPWEKAQLARRALELLRFDDVDSVLSKTPDPVSGNAIVENAAAMRGVVLKITHDQNHLGHIQGHLDFLSSPFGAANPLANPAGLMQLVGHVQEHLNAFYVESLQGMVQEGISKGGNEDQVTVTAQQGLFQHTLQSATPMLQQIAEVLQAVQKRQPPPPVPPEVTASLQMAQMENQRKMALDQASGQYRQAEMQSKQTEMQARMALEGAKHQLAQMQQQFEQQMAQLELRFEQQREAQAGQIELAKNDADNRQHQMTELLKNRDDNETALQTKMMELQSKVQEGFASMQQSVEPTAPSFEPMMKDTQSMLGQLEKAKTNDALQTIMESLHGMMAQMAAPTELVRGPDGKAIGMRKLPLQ